MSETQRITDDPKGWLCEACRRQIEKAIEQFTGLRCPVRQADPVSPDKLAGVDWWRQPLGEGSEVELHIGATKEDLLLLGLRALATAGVEEPDLAAQRDLSLELLRQAMVGVANEISVVTKSPVSISQSKTGGPPAEDPVPIQVSIGPDTTVTLYLAIEQSAEEWLRNSLKEAESHGGTETAEPSIRPSDSSGPQLVPSVPQSFHLLADVELPVSVSFGRTFLLLKEVLKLSSGSIVELNRGVSEPVDLIVNNCVIARGEVVVVDGNYGVRIRQIISPNERLRTLF
jgi:flagellar motor switch protein FliN/FliY